MDEHPRREQPATDYEHDFYAWANEQAALLREGRFSEADVANIAEEIESLGRSEKRELVNRLAVLLAHLLKWQFQPDRRGKSWRLTIVEQRNRLGDHLDENASLRSEWASAVARAYRDAIVDVQKETPLEAGDLPAACPYTAQEILDQAFLPDSAGLPAGFRPPGRSKS
jgi:hypothetical protein